ncbi:MAG: hypothetical protein ACOWWM_14165 [Desulfobacterales bacterium]
MRSTQVSEFSPWLHRFFVATVGLLALTGFAQMPIFKRYYIADLPGLGWLSQYFLTHYLHYLGAVILLAIMAYAVADLLLTQAGHHRATVSGWVQAAFLAGLVATGVPRVIKNYEGYYLSEGWIVFLDIFHLAMAMGFLTCGTFRLLAGKQWTTRR